MRLLPDLILRTPPCSATLFTVAFSTTYLGVGFGVRLVRVLVLEYLLPSRSSFRLQAWWERRPASQQSMLILAVAVGLPLFVTLTTWDWRATWTAAGLRWLSWFVVANLVTLEVSRPGGCFNSLWSVRL
jgi:hypothetical protein